ncbi:MAG: abortive infection family protein [Acidobacteriota bacterium]|nr:abortive infection family protein [Acidobacteriota bacterium]
MAAELKIDDSIRRIQELIIGRGTGKISPNDEDSSNEFATLRKELISSSQIQRKNFPKDLIEIQSLNMFWDKKLSKFQSYKERREYVYDLFKDYFIEIELSNDFPLDKLITESLSFDDIDEYWRKALERTKTEPEGAITMARTLLEATCKKILDDMKEHYSDKDDLPKLYRTLADKLDLSPDNQTEQIFKQILGSCQSVVNGLASVRNKHSDAHGIVKKTYKPAIRHAELAVNLAGTMATFLVATWKERKT